MINILLVMEIIYRYIEISNISNIDIRYNDNDITNITIYNEYNDISKYRYIEEKNIFFKFLKYRYIQNYSHH